MRLTVCAALAVSLVACSSGTPSHDAAPQGSAGAGAGHTPAPAPTTPGAAGTTPGIGPGGVPSPAAPGAAPSGSAPASPAPTTNGFAWARDVRTDAVVSPSCVRPGGRLTLPVRSERAAGVVFQAIYADGAGGAASPWGGGYGGNDKGQTDRDGRFTATWVVASNAPPGRGHVDVVVGWDGKYGYDDPTFEVGTC